MYKHKNLGMATAAAFCLFSGNAMAAGNAGIFYSDFGDLDGFGIEGSMHVSENFRLFGDVSFVDDGPVDLDIVRIGGSYVMPINDELSMEFGGSYQNWDFSIDNPFGPNESVDDNAIGLHAMINMIATPELHLRGHAELLIFDDFDDEEFVIGGRATYFFNPEISMFGALDIYTGDVVDETNFRIGVSFNF